MVKKWLTLPVIVSVPLPGGLRCNWRILPNCRLYDIGTTTIGPRQSGLVPIAHRPKKGTRRETQGRLGWIKDAEFYDGVSTSRRH